MLKDIPLPVTFGIFGNANALLALVLRAIFFPTCAGRELMPQYVSIFLPPSATFPQRAGSQQFSLGVPLGF